MLLTLIGERNEAIDLVDDPGLRRIGKLQRFDFDCLRTVQ
jgi:hypothetical protein